MSVADFSFSAVAPEVIRTAWPAMTALMVAFGAWARRLRRTAPSITALLVSWTSATASIAALAILLTLARRPVNGEDIWQPTWYPFAQTPGPALLTFLVTQVIILARPTADWFTVMLVAMSGLAASLTITIWLWLVPLPSLTPSPSVLFALAMAASIAGFTLAVPLWLTALRLRHS